MNKTADKFDFWAITFAFLLGILAFSNSVWFGLTYFEDPAWDTLFGSFAEEIFKFLAVTVVYLPFRKKVNPFVIAFAVAISFALVENAISSIANSNLRLFPILIHLISTLLSASSIVITERRGWLNGLWVIPAFLLLAFLFHLSYNAIVINEWYRVILFI